MRKIEQQMLDAVRAGKTWSKANTATSARVEPDGTYVDVYLHGHHIAVRHPDGRILPNLDTLADWPTVTTRSRLRALGLDVYSDRGYTCYNGAHVAPSR